MQDVLLQLALTSNGRTSSYDSSGGGTPDYVLVDDNGRAKLGRGDAPHLFYTDEWNAALDDTERAAVLKAATDELDRIRRSHANPEATETKQERDRRIVSQGKGWPAREVANAIRCGITDVHKARQAAGLDIEYGEKRVDARELSRDERNAEIVRLHRRGMNPFQIASALNIPRSSVRYVLAAPKPPPTHGIHSTPLWGTMYPMHRTDQIEALYRREASRLHRVVARNVHADDAIIDDACSFAWAQLVAHESVDPTDTAVFAWLATVAIREGWRLAKIEQRADVRLDDDEAGIDPASAVNVAEHAEAREALRLLDTLTPKQAQMMRLFAAGLSYEEIATVLGVTYTNVNKHLTKARAKLRERREGGE